LPAKPWIVIAHEKKVNALAAQQGIDKNHLTPVGVLFACPVASNKSEDGRAKNRRVELVEN
jgi:outer membrane protein OmpA-like peptidoglycan-associated protein